MAHQHYIPHEGGGIRTCAYIHHAQHHSCHKFKTDFASAANVMCHVYANSLTVSADYISFVVLAHGRPGLIHEKQDTQHLTVSALELHVVTGRCMRGSICKQYLKCLSIPRNTLETPQAQLSHVCQLSKLHPKLVGQSWDGLHVPHQAAHRNVGEHTKYRNLCQAHRL